VLSRVEIPRPENPEKIILIETAHDRESTLICFEKNRVGRIAMLEDRYLDAGSVTTGPNPRFSSGSGSDPEPDRSNGIPHKNQAFEVYNFGSKQVSEF
jgi:hypothetical protein